MQIAYKFRLYPTKMQEQRLLETLELCRQTYNYFLSQWNDKEKIPSRFELQDQLPKLKVGNPELNKVYSKVLQMVLHQLYSNLAGMVRNHNLAGKILDASWGKFLQMLSYKAERAGKMLVKVSPRGTSKEGDKGMDRDYRASLNILERSLTG